MITDKMLQAIIDLKLKTCTLGTSPLIEIYGPKDIVDAFMQQHSCQDKNIILVIDEHMSEVHIQLSSDGSKFFSTQVKE